LQLSGAFKISTLPETMVMYFMSANRVALPQKSESSKISGSPVILEIALQCG